MFKVDVPFHMAGCIIGVCHLKCVPSASCTSHHPSTTTNWTLLHWSMAYCASHCPSEMLLLTVCGQSQIWNNVLKTVASSTQNEPNCVTCKMASTLSPKRFSELTRFTIWDGRNTSRPCNWVFRPKNTHNYDKGFLSCCRRLLFKCNQPCRST